MTIDVQLLLHPYTARKDVGAGHDRYAFELLTHLSACGANVATFESGPLSGISSALIAEARAVVRLAMATRSENTVYHATATMNAMAPITARKHPLVTTIHDVLWFFVGSRFDSRAKSFLKQAGIRRAARGSDKLIVPFASTRDFLERELAVPAENIHIVQYGVDHVQFRPPSVDEKIPRPACLPNVDGRIVLFVGATNLAKGVDTLLKCFPEVVSKIPDAHLVIGSGGWDTPALREMGESSRVKDRIHFTGFIPEADLRGAYVHCDVCVFPSRYGFGLATLESMACGTPTVSGRTLDAPEFVGDAGLLADPERPDELAAQIVRVLDDAQLTELLSARGLEKSAAYRWEHTAAKTAEVYRTLL